MKLLFTQVSLLWLIFTCFFCLDTGVRGGLFLICFWSIAFFDFFTLFGLSSVLLERAIKKRRFQLFQALCCAIFKVACMGLLVGILKGSLGVPLKSVLFGLSTLLVVPVISGIFFQRRVVK